jgi:hypothetical protein
MTTQLLKGLAIVSLLSATSAYAQEKTTLYYDQNGKGLDTKKKAAYYRVVNLDQNNNPVGTVEDFYPNDKPMASGVVVNVDKFDNTKSHWKGQVTTYNEKGKLSGYNNYDNEGLLDGVQTVLNADGEKIQEMNYTHGNPAKDYYLVYDKKGQTSRYSYLTHLPMKLSTTDKNIMPITQRKVIYQDDQPVQFYFVDGLSVAVKLSTKQLYGDYYEAYITIENGSGNQFDYDPSEITASFIYENEPIEGEVMVYKDYLKKVKRRQAWTAAFSAFANVAAASAAGYSSTSTNVYAKSSSGKSVAVHATSTTYDAGAQLAATQNAANNMNQLSNQQYDIKQTISEGYLKKNTIFSNSRLVGFVNIKYEKADHILLNIPVNGRVYHFEL